MASKIQRPLGAARSDISKLLPASSEVERLFSHAGVARSLRFMAANFTRPIRVTDLDKVAGLSRRGLHKAFRKHTGCGPGQLLRQFRINQARQILEDGDLPLDRVAAACGYRSVNSFWVAFRQVVGVAPKQYQKQVFLRTQYNQRGKAALLIASGGVATRFFTNHRAAA